MILFQWLNFYSYRQYESHSFMRMHRSKELLWKMQLPLEWTFQVNVFTYSTLDATLRASLQSKDGRSIFEDEKIASLWEKQLAAILSCMCLGLFIYFRSIMQATRWHKCSHGNMTLVYVVLPEFCPEFPLLLCIISGILEYLCNPSCL